MRKDSSSNRQNAELRFLAQILERMILSSSDNLMVWTRSGKQFAKVGQSSGLWHKLKSRLLVIEAC
jgi:hypothetical protein